MVGTLETVHIDEAKVTNDHPIFNITRFKSDRAGYV